MSQATITIKKVWTSEGSGDYGPYTKYDVQPREDEKARYVTFKDELGQEAQGYVGKRVIVTYEEGQGKNPKLTGIVALDGDVAGNAADTGAPLPGTGDYIKGKDAPETQRSISASVALKEAVNRCERGEDVLATADAFYDWLMSKVAAPPTDSPAPATGSEPSANREPTPWQRVSKLLEQLEEALPTQDGQNSHNKEIRLWSEDKFGKKSHEFTPDEVGLVVKELEKRLAEAGVPF